MKTVTCEANLFCHMALKNDECVTCVACIRLMLKGTLSRVDMRNGDHLRSCVGNSVFLPSAIMDLPVSGINLHLFCILSMFC